MICFPIYNWNDEKVAHRLDIPESWQIYSFYFVNFLFGNEACVCNELLEDQLFRLVIDLQVWEIELEVSFTLQIISNPLNPIVFQYKAEKKCTKSLPMN